MERLTPMQVVAHLSRVAQTYPTNTPEYMAITIAAGVMAGLHMSNGLNEVLVDGKFPLPDSLSQALEHGDGSVDMSAFGKEPPDMPHGQT